MEKMLKYIGDVVAYDWLGLSADSTFASALSYFIHGFVYIAILVIIITFIMGIVNSYLPIDKIRNYLDKHRSFGWGNLLASLLGAVTPFCSCSSIPLFVGMMQSRIPLGIALSFLITSPLVNEVAVALFLTTYGLKFTIIYVLSGILLGVVGGILLEKLGMAKYVADWVLNMAENHGSASEEHLSFKDRLPAILSETKATVKKLMPYIAIGLGIGSFIHGYVPEEFFKEHLSGGDWWSVPLAVVTAIPLYIDAVGVLPVIETLIAKGVPIGTAIGFMMGAVGLSLPEALLLKKVMKTQLVVAFFVTIGLGMIASGYFFNAVL